MSGVTCHMSRVTSHMSHVTFFIFFGQSCEAFWWRVCYQWGLPRLFYLLLRFLRMGPVFSGLCCVTDSAPSSPAGTHSWVDVFPMFIALYLNNHIITILVYTALHSNVLHYNALMYLITTKFFITLHLNNLHIFIHIYHDNW